MSTGVHQAGGGFTPAQSTAIHASGNILVVAGAGTGKTRTLIERTLRLVREGASLDRLLMVTFTQAAASEMKVRLRSGLERLAAEDPANPHYPEQLALLDSALICTLHSFCLDLIRDHFHELAIDPMVIVLDDRQIQPLIEQSFETVLAPFFIDQTSTASAVRAFLRKWAGDAPRRLRSLVLRLHRYGLSLPDPEAWFAEQEHLFAAPTPERWREWLVLEFTAWSSDWLARLRLKEGVSNIAKCCSALEKWAQEPPSFARVRQTLEAIQQADQTEWPRGTRTTVRAKFERFFDELSFLGSLMTSEEGTVVSDPLQEDWDRVRGEMKVLLLLVRRFNEEFFRAKRELGGVDFADLEQLSLRLLCDRQGQPTAAALETRKRFDHVFVDEVQDINAAQDAILRAVSREGLEANRFLVGDIKQSIYRFRLADPSIFRAYLQAWQTTPAKGQVVALSDNFRSRESVLETVNSIFGVLMRPELGGVAYNAQAKLLFGNPDGRALLRHRDAVPQVELRVLFPPDDEVSEVGDLSRVEQEARWIAHRLRELKELAHPVWDEKLHAFRAVKWSDMVVLLRSPGSKTESFAKEFHRAGVPLLASRGGFFASQEIQDLLSLLRLLDNPLQDIPLLAVLRSPMVGLSMEELTWIRAVDRKSLLWTAMLQGLAKSEEVNGGEESFRYPEPLRIKLNSFVESCARWREVVRLGSLSGCLETVLADTRYEVLLEAEPRGRSRVANVHRLLDLTRQYDPYQRQGLFRFLRFVDAQEESEQDLEPSPGHVEDAVELMSVHKSKGLEFPIVVVADLGKRFNLDDLREDVLLDVELGLCSRIWLEESRQHYPSLAHWLAARRGRVELLGEEMRLLYVAFTRAKDRLILTGQGTPSEWECPMGKEESGGSTTVDASQLVGASSAMSWLHFWFAQAIPAESWTGDRSGNHGLLSWTVGPLEEGGVAPEPAPSLQMQSHPDSDVATDVALLLQRLSWRYTQEAATREPVKTAVSILRRRGRESMEESRPLWRPSVERFRLQPPPASRSGMSAAERGTVHHEFLQWVDLSRAESRLDLRNEGERLLREGVMTEDEVSVLDFDALAAFWQSEVGREIRRAREAVHRELPFTASLTARELVDLGIRPREGELDPSEFVVVQGQIDLAVIQPEEIWLLDYKTDTIPPEEVVSRAELYQVQLRIYALALQKIYRRPVTRRWIHFIRPGISLSMPS